MQFANSPPLNALKQPVEVEWCPGETLDWKPYDGRVLDITMSTPGEVNMNLRREVQDRHIRARARRVA
jgi:hypothetical protein